MANSRYGRNLNRMTIEEVLQEVLLYPDYYQPNGWHGRPPAVTEALCVAMSYLPYGGKHQRALDYVVRNPEVIFNFCGTDAVGQAINVALDNMLSARRQQ